MYGIIGSLMEKHEDEYSDTFVCPAKAGTVHTVPLGYSTNKSWIYLNQGIIYQLQEFYNWGSCGGRKK